MRKVSRLVAFVLLIPSARRKTQWNLYLTRRNEICTPLNRPDFSPNLSGKRGKAFRFTNAWEQRKLGNLGETYTGLSGKSKEDFGHGTAKFITYMNVYSNPVSDPEGTDLIEVDNRQNTVRKGDVLFTTSSETPEEVGMSSVVFESIENTYLNSFCFGYRPKIEFNNFYLAFLLRSGGFRKNIIFLAQGISRYNISKNAVMNIPIGIGGVFRSTRTGNVSGL